MRGSKAHLGWEGVVLEKTKPIAKKVSTCTSTLLRPEPTGLFCMRFREVLSQGPLLVEINFLVLRNTHTK